jgi:hypothetical protein
LYLPHYHGDAFQPSQTSLPLVPKVLYSTERIELGTRGPRLVELSPYLGDVVALSIITHLKVNVEKKYRSKFVG